MSPISTVLVIANHLPAYPNPITLHIGDHVIAERRDREYPGWIWVRTPDGNKGWAPEQYLSIRGRYATATEDYSAQELTTRVGEKLVVYQALARWIWAMQASGKSGWVPAETVVPIEIHSPETADGERRSH